MCQLDRFIVAQDQCINNVIQELNNNRKKLRFLSKEDLFNLNIQLLFNERKNKYNLNTIFSFLARCTKKYFSF